MSSGCLADMRISYQTTTKSMEKLTLGKPRLALHWFQYRDNKEKYGLSTAYLEIKLVNHVMNIAFLWPANLNTCSL